MKKIVCILSIISVLLISGCGPDNGASNSSKSVGESSTSYEYIANKNSKKLHYYTCDSLPYEQNRVYFSSEEAANEAGYVDNHKECMGNR